MNVGSSKGEVSLCMPFRHMAGIAPLIINLSNAGRWPVSVMPWMLNFQKLDPGLHWIGWMSFRASMDAIKERKICCTLQGINHNSGFSFCWDW